MSSLIVDVCRVEEIAMHPNADLIERVRVKNWWCVAMKGKYHVGDKVVYIPPDAILPEDLAEKWGIKKYCPPCDGGFRVKACRLRGVSSFGTIQDLDDTNWEVGKNLQEHYGILKYEPPVKQTQGDAAKPVSAFHAYTSIEALGNFPDVFKDGETVIVTEKIHGTNSRIGYVNNREKDSDVYNWEFMAGSHSVRRNKQSVTGAISSYWMPFFVGAKENESPTPVENLLMLIKEQENAQMSVIIFGEIFGAGVQDMTYGQSRPAYRIFDIAVDGNYLPWEKLVKYTDEVKSIGVLLVPVLYCGPYSLAKMDELVDGPTTICDSTAIKEVFKGREGIVIKTYTERYDDVRGARTILKYVSADYHDRRNKNRSEDH